MSELLCKVDGSRGPRQMGANALNDKDKCTITKFCTEILKPRLIAVSWQHASNMLFVNKPNELDYCDYL